MSLLTGNTLLTVSQEFRIMVVGIAGLLGLNSHEELRKALLLPIPCSLINSSLVIPHPC